MAHFKWYYPYKTANWKKGLLFCACMSEFIKYNNGVCKARIHKCKENYTKTHTYDNLDILEEIVIKNGNSCIFLLYTLFGANWPKYETVVHLYHSTHHTML